MPAIQKHHPSILETTLDLPLAIEIASNGFLEAPGNDSTANLRRFKFIHPDAIRYLRRFNYDWVDFGLEVLSPVLAKEIAAWKVGGMSFADGMATYSEALCCFDHSQTSLTFEDISDALDLQSAAALGRGMRFLSFSTTHLSPQIAELIARHLGWLQIKLNQPISPESMQMLASHIGEQVVLHLKQPITTELLMPLIQNSAIRYIHLNGLFLSRQYESALLLCKQSRYIEIMMDIDLTSAMAFGPIF